jgi:hypothetical protein
LPPGPGFRGAVLANHHVYLIPGGPFGNQLAHGKLVRHDRRCAFDDPDAWESFDLVPVGDGKGKLAKGFCGGVFDGRYVYVIPRDADTTMNSVHGSLVRYDTEQPFLEPTSYVIADLSTIVDPGARGYCGGIFDGRYVYLVPNRLGAPALKYDTHARSTQEPAGVRST